MEKTEDKVGWFLIWTLGLSSWSPFLSLALVAFFSGDGSESGSRYRYEPPTFREQLADPEVLLGVAILWLGALPAASGAWLIWQRTQDWREGIQWFAVSIGATILVSFAMFILIIFLGFSNAESLQRLVDAVGENTAFNILIAIAYAVGSLPVWIVLMKSRPRKLE